jgi:hypothetical protein
VIEVTATVVGAAEVQAKFAGAADKARPVLRSRVQRLGLELLRKVKAEKLRSAPQGEGGEAQGRCCIGRRVACADR